MTFDLGGYFLQAFGYRSAAFDPQFDRVTPKGAGQTAFNPSLVAVRGNSTFTRTETGGLGSPYYAQNNLLGVEIYLPVEIAVGNDLLPGNVPGTPGTQTAAEALAVTDSDGSLSGTWLLPNPVVCADIVIRKHIVDTELTERNGMVSELININSFKVNVKGLLINPNNEFPEADFNTINRLFNLNIPVEVNNVVTDILLMQYQGSKTVTLRNLKFTQPKGVKHVVGYELDMVGDIPFNLNLIN